MKFTRRSALLAIFCLALSASPAFADDPATPGDHAETITVGDLKRTYLLHVPPGYDKRKPVPLVLMLHGRGGNAQYTARTYAWSELADKENFVVCYPEALPDRQGQNAWNAVFDTGQKADDVAFLSVLLTRLRSTLAVDPKRVYMNGHSSGGMMTYRFGAEKGADVSALGVVAGSIGSDYGTVRSIRVAKPTTPISLIAFHGKADATVGYDWRTKGGDPPIFRFVPAPESVNLFVAANGADKKAKRDELSGGSVVRETFAGGKNGTEVVFYSIADGSHRWPGANYAASQPPASGPATKDVDATALIWEFFKTHPRR
ncbi:MAG: hypothetical protein H7145_12610 [Akkermansiaceae bacterium]|nr:hypothetical protein [Armatimonadota bacterium]